MLRIHTRIALLAAALTISSITAVAQQPQPPAFVAGAKTAALTDVVPVDPRIASGTLANGLRYYVRRNLAPRNRAELRLVVNAGSLLEDENQRGLAHFVEHMAFNGTEHFPKQDVVSFMQTIGMRFGAHVNAHTGFDETVYQLQIPTDNPLIIDRSLLIMEDWTHNVSFLPEEIDKERGVILEEWRLGLGAGSRVEDQQFPVLFKGSRYAERLPIGKPEVLRSFRHEELTRFYQDWYRPDLMAVIAVGDFDPLVVEGLIRGHFGRIPSATSPRPRSAFNVPDQPSTLYSIVTDPEATTTTVSVLSKTAFRGQSTIGDYRQSLVDRLFAGMLSARLDEIAQKPNPPFLAAETNRGLWMGSTEMTTINAIVSDGGVEPALTALFTEATRVARFGFTATELERQKADMRLGLQQTMANEAAHTSDALADEYIRNFMQQEPIPGIPYEMALHDRFVPSFTLQEINALAKDWIADRNRVVMVTAPRKSGVIVPDEAKLAAAITAATSVPMTAYVDTVSQQPLLDPLPTPGTIAKTTTKDAFGIVEWELSNGARVVLKPTTSKEDEILFGAISLGGTSLASDDDFISARTASDVIARSGLGNLNENNLEKLLAGKTAVVRPEIDDNDEGLRGGSMKRDLETLFQLIYLSFTQPRADADAFRTTTGQLTAALANREALPEAAFADALRDAVTQGHLRARPLTTALIGQMDLQKSFAFYKERFADASDFTFVFVGSFDTQTMKPLVERYLASLPTLHRREMVRDVGIHPPDGIVERHVTKGVEPKSEVSVVFSGSFQNDQLHRIVMRAMAETLEGSLHRTLREDLGGTYGVSVRTEFSKEPRSEYRLMISFGCDPARMDALVRTLFQVIEQFKVNGPTMAQVADVRAALARDLETNTSNNRYLLDQLTFKYEYGEDVAEVFTLRQSYEQVTPAAIREAAVRTLDLQRYVKVTLMPERPVAAR